MTKPTEAIAIKHQHESCANIHEAFSTFIGCTVKGVLFNALPSGRADLSQGTKTLVFDCGWGLTISSNGSYWPELPDEVRRAIQRKRQELATSQSQLKGVLKLAGEQP